MKVELDSSLINLRNFSSISIRKPILVAHRGGVITPNSPENSLAAIRFSGDNAYDMVELDVVEAKDTKPVLFHGPKGHLGRDCGIDAYVHDLASEELMNIHYRESNQHIINLSKALELCCELNLGVMLDVKNYGHKYSEQFFAQIAELLKVHKLCNASFSFSQDPLAYKYLRDVLMLAISEEELNKLTSSQSKSLENRWWFGLPEQVTSRLVTELQKRGALVIIAINRFRYPSHTHRALAEKDVQRLIKMGVNGLQIDSIYYQFVEPTHKDISQMRKNITKSSAKRVQDFLSQRGIEFVVRELPGSTRTAEDAAISIGCEISQIAKSLIFKNKNSGNPILVIASGANIVSITKIEDATGMQLEKANANYVREKTGYVIGGVPPIAHKGSVTTILDPDLKKCDVIWAAAGTPNAVFKLKASELENLTGGKWIELSK